MKMFGKKKSSIARAARRLIKKAVTNPRTGRRFPIIQPLLVALGHATFPSEGPGEIFVPVKKMERAVHIACKEEMATTQRVVVIHPIDEHRTSKCCSICKCFKEEGPKVQKWDKRNEEWKYQESGRLRVCTNPRCAKNILVNPGVNQHWVQVPRWCDRDEQASANMLKVMWSMIMGKGRPVQFQRKDQRALGGDAFLDRQLVRSHLCDQLTWMDNSLGKLIRIPVHGPEAVPFWTCSNPPISLVALVH